MPDEETRKEEQASGKHGNSSHVILILILILSTITLTQSFRTAESGHLRLCVRRDGRAYRHHRHHLDKKLRQQTSQLPRDEMLGHC